MDIDLIEKLNSHYNKKFTTSVLVFRPTNKQKVIILLKSNSFLNSKSLFCNSFIEEPKTNVAHDASSVKISYL